jgi:hypothetical protein
LTAFLRLLSELDLNGISDRRLALSLDDDQGLDDAAKRKLRTLLLRDGGAELITELLETDWLETHDIVNVGYRKRQLSQFELLMKSEVERDAYRRLHHIREDQPEAVWQHFFANNDWIFGYGLDYRFQGVLQTQAHLAGTDIRGREAVIGDFLLADKRFTTFVEIKTPDTQLFGQTRNRSRAWRLSTDLMDSLSQILEHKASGELRFAQGKLFDENGEVITQKPYDPKVVLVIGSWEQLAGDADQVKEIKERTFELFRRDSRNVEIMTFDELLERARFIVEHGSSVNDK